VQEHTAQGTALWFARLNQYYSDDKIKKTVKTMEFGTQEEGSNAHRDFVRENWGKETTCKI
jgi:hypothetical protein